MIERGALLDGYEDMAAKDDLRRARARRSDGHMPTAELLSDQMLKVFDAAGSALSGKPSTEILAALDSQISFAVKHAELRAQFLGMSPDMLATKLAKAPAAISHIEGLCESPIEKRMLPWLILEDYGPKVETFPAAVFNHRTDERMPLADVVIAPQFAFVRYRMDFAVIARKGDERKIFAVECDGEKFHNASDNKRDACLRSFGIQTVRASGREIHARPRNLSAAVSALVQEWMEQ